MKPSWQHCRLADVCRLLNGRAYSQNELLQSGTFPVLRVGNFFTNKNWYYSDLALPPDKYCDRGDLLYAWSASFGPKIWDGGRVIYHYHIWKIIPDVTKIEKKFLYYFLDLDKDLIRADQGAGTTMIHVTKGSMEQREIAVPPLPEQKRIVAILDEAFAGIDVAIDNTKKNIEAAAFLIDQAFSSLLAGEPGVPTTTLSAIADFKNGLNYSKNSKGQSVNIVGVKDFAGNDNVPFDALANVAIDGELSEDYLLRGGDIVTVRSNGNRQLIGRVLLAQEPPVRTSHSGFTIRIRPDARVVRSEFLFRYLRTRAAREELIESGEGANISSLNQKALARLLVPLPSLTEQDQLVDRTRHLADQGEALSNAYARKLTSLEALKQSILHRAFAGDLTATPDRRLEAAAE